MRYDDPTDEEWNECLQRFYQHLTAWAEELSRLVREAPEDAATVMRYILSVAGHEPFDTLRERIIEVVPATENVMATAAEQLIQRGMAEGKAEGMADAVLAIFETRGTPVTVAERERILANRDLAELARWLRRAVTAESVAELFSR